jgi:copper homeostasis protein CutC
MVVLGITFHMAIQMSEELNDEAIEEGAVYLESGFYTKEELEDVIRAMDRLKSYIKDMVMSGLQTKH